LNAWLRRRGLYARVQVPLKNFFEMFERGRKARAYEATLTGKRPSNTEPNGFYLFRELMKNKIGTVIRDSRSEATSPAISEIASP
jgi:hypothetical protein